MTRGGDATPEPFDLSEISRSGDLFDDLAARRVPDLTADDPAVRFLAALVADVDAGAPPLPARPPRVACAGAKPGRPVVRAFVTFGAATLMLATAGAAAAGGGAGQGPKAAGPAVQRLDVSERSKGDVAAHAPPIGRRTAPAGRAGDPATGAGRDRHNAAPAGRPEPAVTPSGRPGTGSRRPPGGRGGVVGPITSGPFAPAPSLSPSSPPASSEPPASPPADPTDGSSPSPGSGPRDHPAAIESSARRVGAAAPDGSDQERATAGQDRTTI